MKITIFTRNHSRHINLINLLSKLAQETFVIIECDSLFLEQQSTTLVNNLSLQEYMSQVRIAEKKVFGDINFMPPKVRSLCVKKGEINKLSYDQIRNGLSSDVYVVFGSSYIKGWLADYLISHNALNLHMGISPYYRGAACNFWAIYDSKPNFVGATIHYLSEGLDDGPILFHSIPAFNAEDPFLYSMKSVKVAQIELVKYLKIMNQLSISPIQQIKSLEKRYSVNSDFTNEVAADFMSRNLTSRDLRDLLHSTEKPNLLLIDNLWER